MRIWVTLEKCTPLKRGAIRQHASAAVSGRSTAFAIRGASVKFPRKPLLYGEAHISEWIGLEEGLALRGASLIRALRAGDILAEGSRPSRFGGPEEWLFMPAAIWCRDAMFFGEPGFPMIDGRTVQGMPVAFRAGGWWNVRLRRRDVEALPKPPGVIHQAVLTWLLHRAAEVGRLNQTAEFHDCQKATGCTWREYLPAFRDLPEKFRYTRGRR